VRLFAAELLRCVLVKRGALVAWMVHIGTLLCIGVLLFRSCGACGNAAANTRSCGK
jgi:hypothetical protein